MSYQCLSDTQPKARKEIPCIWCSEKINRGETYRRQVGKYFGEFQSNCFHIECFNAALEHFREEEDFPPHAFKRGTLEEK